jgi:hypothetical protein
MVEMLLLAVYALTNGSIAQMKELFYEMFYEMSTIGSNNIPTTTYTGRKRQSGKQKPGRI